MVIKRVSETDDRAGRFINEAFTDYAIKSNVKLNFEEYCFAAELVKKVEEEYSGKGYEKITLTTFGFQAPEFYKKLGYSLEFVREDKDPKLSKYFYSKAI